MPLLARQSNKITLNCRKRGVVTTIHSLSKAEFIEKGGYAIWLALHRAEDVQADNVAGTFPNPVERGLTIEARHEMIFDKAVAAVTFKSLYHDGRNTFAYPVFCDWRADASEQTFRFTACFAIKRRHKTEGQPSGRFGFEGEVGNDARHYWLVNKGALKGPAICNVVGSLCHRLTHQSG